MLSIKLLNFCRLLRSQVPCQANLFSKHVRTLHGVDYLKKSIKQGVGKYIEPLCSCDDSTTLHKCSKSTRCQYRVKEETLVYIKTYGCQMNENDSSIVAAILEEFGYKITSNQDEAEIYLLMTCAIRDSAERKIWGKLRQLKANKQSNIHPLKQIGLLGCMAERLKQKVLEGPGSVDIVAGPDAYRDLPRLFAVNKLTQEEAINCLLSFDETYSDIRPVTSPNDVMSYVSITRGCDNLCSYCIVPFTRGRERSRPISTILDEVKGLVERGIKEVILLGQNVNSYRDLETNPETIGRGDLVEKTRDKEKFAEGFKTIFKPRLRGMTFDILLEEVAKLSPELRIRFTSPHPKDFTDDVIDVISRYPNIPKCIHLPAQSGSDKILAKMRRGYTKRSYLDLVQKMRNSIPNLALTSDFIAGFCDETEADHEDTIDLIKRVNYTYIYSFPYSMRDKTHAFHKLEDNVDKETKSRRTDEILKLFREQATHLNNSLVGSTQLVLIEAESKRSDREWKGRIDTNIKTIVPKGRVLNTQDDGERSIKPADYVACEIIEANSQTLKALPLYITTQYDYYYGNSNRLRGMRSSSS